MSSRATDPVTALRAATALAAADLAQVSCHDPAAARAMHAVRLARMTLEDFWLPALDDLATPPTQAS